MDELAILKRLAKLIKSGEIGSEEYKKLLELIPKTTLTIEHIKSSFKEDLPKEFQSPL